MIVTDSCRQLLTRLCTPTMSAAPSASAEIDIQAAVSAAVSSRFRRSAVDERSRSDLVGKIEGALASQSPIEFSIPFGGYKSWHEPSFPLPNWAEVFSLGYLRDYFLGITEVYPYGVRASFSYTSGVMDEVSNMPLTAQDEYLNALRPLLAHFSDDALSLELFDIATLYDSGAQLHEELDANLSRIAADWDALLPQEEQEKKVASARRNLMLEGIENLASLPPAQLETRFRESAMRCDALDSLKARRQFNKFSNRIQLVFIRGPIPSVHVGSCETSSNHFWVGTGVLDVAGTKTRPRIETTDGLRRRYRGISPQVVDTLELAEYMGLRSLDSCDVYEPAEAS